MSIALYELSDAYQNVLEMIDEIDEENPNEDIMKALRTIEGQLQTKVVNIAGIIRTLDAEAKVIKEEEKRLSARRKTRENTIANMKQYLQVSMEQMHLDRISSPVRTITLQNNPPALNIINADLIPQKFLTLVPEHTEVRNKDVADALKAGEVVPGAELTIGKSLRIR